MRIIDAFFYLTYILLQKFGRDESDAKWSAMLHTSFISSIIILIISILIGYLFKELDALKYIIKNYILVVGIMLFFVVLYYYRFYKKQKIHRVEKYFSSLSSSLNQKLKWFYIIFNIIIFITLVIAIKLIK
jgi:heme A synthase